MIAQVSVSASARRLTASVISSFSTIGGGKKLIRSGPFVRK